MTKFSANLGFLWPELDLPDAIVAAKAAGFDAIECHWPYSADATLVATILSETRLPMLSINTVRGDVLRGEFGTAALPGRETYTRDAVDQALEYAERIGKPDIHVLAGVTEHPDAYEVFLQNLEYACKRADDIGIRVLIEPVNTRDMPGYFLNHTEQATKIIDEVGATNLKLMFDCYHVFIMERDVLDRLEKTYSYIGHIQFSSAPGRGRPDTGEIDFGAIFQKLKTLGYHRPLGAEYIPNGETEQTLGWLATFREA